MPVAATHSNNRTGFGALRSTPVLFHFTDNLRIHLVESEFLKDDAHIEKVFKDVAAIEVRQRVCLQHCNQHRGAQLI